jgi:3-methyladenine DNA glycosylase AlkD
MKPFSIRGEKRLGIPMPVLRAIAKETGTSHMLAARLWTTGIPEARILASLVADPCLMTAPQADR